MIGRACIGNPWFFNQVKYYLKENSYLEPPSIFERVEAVKRHLKMSISWKGEVLGILETRRHYSNYFKGISNFKSIRSRLVTSNSSIEVFEILEEVLEKYSNYEFIA